MTVVNNLSDTIDTESRDQEIQFGFWLMMPAIVCILLPAACLFVYSRYTGYDEYASVMRFLQEYHVALFIPLIMICAALSVSLHLIIFKDVIRVVHDWRANDLRHRFDLENEPIISEGTQRALAGSAAVILVASATGVMFWIG